MHSLCRSCTEYESYGSRVVCGRPNKNINYPRFGGGGWGLEQSTGSCFYFLIFPKFLMMIHVCFSYSFFISYFLYICFSKPCESPSLAFFLPLKRIQFLSRIFQNLFMVYFNVRDLVILFHINYYYYYYY